MDYAGRIARAREDMKRRGIALMYLRRGANLLYLAGIRRGDPELTDLNTYGDHVQGAYIGADGGFTLVAPRVGAADWERQAEGKPWVEEVRVMDESERPKDALKEVLAPFRLRGKGVCMEERAWAQTALLFRELLPYSRLSGAGEVLEPLRMIKDQDEVAVMRKASEVAGEVYGEVVEGLRVGRSELEVASEIDYRLRLHGAEQSSFVTSVKFTSPRHPWDITQPRPLEEGDAACLSFGCVYKGYCSGLGRTVYVGEPPEKVRRIHDVVVEAQALAIEKMLDGQVTAQQLDGVARGVVERAGYGPNFVHRLGQGIGVTVHEPPFLYQNDDTVLRKGMALTVGPSVMLFGEWGARVEDVVLVTERGGEPLSGVHRELTTV